MKIQSKFTVSILSSAFIALITISIIGFYFNYQSSVREARNNLDADTFEHGTEAAYYLKEKIKTASTIASAPVILQSLIKSNAELSLLGEDKRKKKINDLNEKWITAKDIKDSFIQSYINNPSARHLKKQQDTISDEYGEIFLTNRYGSLV